MQTLNEITFSFGNLFDTEGITANPVTVLVSVLVIIFSAAAIYLLISFFGKKEKGDRMTTKDLVTGSICVTLSFVLSLFGFTMPLGGTVTFCSVLPISLFCHYKGFKKSLLFVTAFMLLNLMNCPFIVSAWSMLLDYVIPFGAIAVIGLVPHKKGSAGLKSHISFYILSFVYIVIRYSSHVLSGILFWDLSQDYGMTSLAYSCAYNSFCLVDWGITLALSIPFLSSKAVDEALKKF